MGGKPLVVHCPTESCRDWLRAYQWGRRLVRPRVPMPVPDAPPRLAWRNRRMRRLQWVECPECGHKWESTVA